MKFIVMRHNSKYESTKVSPIITAPHANGRMPSKQQMAAAPPHRLDASTHATCCCHTPSEEKGKKTANIGFVCNTVSDSFR